MLEAAAGTVTADGEAGGQVALLFGWDRSDPAAIVMTIDESGRRVTWWLGREQLRHVVFSGTPWDGHDAAAVLDDDADEVAVTLRPCDEPGECTLTFAAQPLRRLLHRADRCVPVGDDSADWDLVVAQILSASEAAP